MNEHFAAVIDGSTSKVAARIDPSISNGRFCMELIRQYVADMSAYSSVVDFCSGVTDIVRSVYTVHDVDMQLLKEHPEQRLTASVVVYSAYCRQVWIVGDCQCIVNDVFYDNPKPCETEIAAMRASMVEHLLADGVSPTEIQTSDLGRTHILDRLVATCKRQNVDYAVVDGFDIPIDKVKVVNVDSDNDNDIVLASDGYPFLKGTLHESEEALVCQLRDDPLCIRSFKATKGLMLGNVSFDDRCYLRFRP